MIKNFLLTTALCTSFSAAILTSSAQAEDSFSFSVTAVSDYRFRGVSQNDNGFAVQGSVEAATDQFYGGIWASTLAEYNNPLKPLDKTGTTGELNLYGGFSQEMGIAIFDIGLRHYKYLGGQNGDFTEAFSSVGVDLGIVFAQTGVEYAFKNDAIGKNNLYIYLDGEIDPPVFPVGLRAHIGYEDGAFGDKKIDWKLGVFTSVATLVELSLDYVGTNVDTKAMPMKRFDEGIVFAVSVSL